MQKSSSMKMMMALVRLCCCFMAMAVPLAHASVDVDVSPQAVEKWILDFLQRAEPKLTKLHFYYHENRVSHSPTAVEIAQASITSISPTSFGSTFVIDDPLTVGPDPNSQIIGRAQGIYSSASQTDMALILEMNLVFTQGDYNGSTLSILGRDPITNRYRELPISGGSGAFRLATGTVSTHTYSLDPATLNAVVEYNVFIEHY